MEEEVEEEVEEAEEGWKTSLPPPPPLPPPLFLSFLILILLKLLKMSLSTKIFSLLSNHSHKIDSLSTEEFDALRDLKRMVTSGMVGEVVSSIREYLKLQAPR